MDIYREWIGEVMARANEPARVELRAEHAEILRALQCKDRTGCMQAIDRHYDRIEQEFHRTTTEKEQHMNRKLVIFDMDGTILRQKRSCGKPESLSANLSAEKTPKEILRAAMDNHSTSAAYAARHSCLVLALCLYA